MYIRVKTLKNIKYAYLVRSKYYKNKGPKQVFSKYLGKLYSKDRIHDNIIDYSEEEIENKDIKVILKELLENELKNHELSSFKVDFDKKKVLDNKGRKCVLKINNGYLCNYTLKNLFEFEPTSANEAIFSKELARVIIESGIDIGKQNFIFLFDKIYKSKVPDNING